MESDETIENDKILDQRESKSNESSSKASRVTKPPVLLIQNGDCGEYNESDDECHTARYVEQPSNSRPKTPISPLKKVTISDPPITHMHHSEEDSNTSQASGSLSSASKSMALIETSDPIEMQIVLDTIKKIYPNVSVHFCSSKDDSSSPTSSTSSPPATTIPATTSKKSDIQANLLTVNYSNSNGGISTATTTTTASANTTISAGNDSPVERQESRDSGVWSHSKDSFESMKSFSIGDSNSNSCHTPHENHSSTSSSSNYSIKSKSNPKTDSEPPGRGSTQQQQQQITTAYNWKKGQAWRYNSSYSGENRTLSPTSHHHHQKDTIPISLNATKSSSSFDCSMPSAIYNERQQKQHGFESNEAANMQQDDLMNGEGDLDHSNSHPHNNPPIVHSYFSNSFDSTFANQPNMKRTMEKSSDAASSGVQDVNNNNNSNNLTVFHGMMHPHQQLQIKQNRLLASHSLSASSTSVSSTSRLEMLGKMSSTGSGSHENASQEHTTSSSLDLPSGNKAQKRRGKLMREKTIDNADENNNSNNNNNNTLSTNTSHHHHYHYNRHLHHCHSEHCRYQQQHHHHQETATAGGWRSSSNRSLNSPLHRDSMCQCCSSGGEDDDREDAYSSSSITNSIAAKTESGIEGGRVSPPEKRVSLFKHVDHAEKNKQNQQQQQKINFIVSNFLNSKFFASSGSSGSFDDPSSANSLNPSSTSAVSTTATTTKRMSSTDMNIRQQSFQSIGSPSSHGSISPAPSSPPQLAQHTLETNSSNMDSISGHSAEFYKDLQAKLSIKSSSMENNSDMIETNTTSPSASSRPSSIHLSSSGRNRKANRYHQHNKFKMSAETLSPNNQPNQMLLTTHNNMNFMKSGGNVGSNFSSIFRSSSSPSYSTSFINSQMQMQQQFQQGANQHHHQQTSSSSSHLDPAPNPTPFFPIMAHNQIGNYNHHSYLSSLINNSLLMPSSTSSGVGVLDQSTASSSSSKPAPPPMFPFQSYMSSPFVPGSSSSFTKSSSCHILDPNNTPAHHTGPFQSNEPSVTATAMRRSKMMPKPPEIVITESQNMSTTPADTPVGNVPPDSPLSPTSEVNSTNSSSNVSPTSNCKQLSPNFSQFKEENPTIYNYYESSKTSSNGGAATGTSSFERLLKKTQENLFISIRDKMNGGDQQLNPNSSASACASPSISLPTSPSSSNMTNGSSSGSNNKPHVCPTCQKRFARSDMLIRHSRLHSGIRPYKCTRCGQEFSRSDHLNTHLRTHTGEKPYTCPHPKCSYAACRKDMITRHLKVHTKNRSFDTALDNSATNGAGNSMSPNSSMFTSTYNTTNSNSSSSSNNLASSFGNMLGGLLLNTTNAANNKLKTLPSLSFESSISNYAATMAAMAAMTTHSASFDMMSYGQPAQQQSQLSDDSQQLTINNNSNDSQNVVVDDEDENDDETSN